MGPSTRAIPERSRERGMTLFELLFVMALIGLLVGAGVGAFSTLDFGRRAAVGMVQNVLRSARNSAQSRSAPARVRIDPAAGSITAEGMAVIGTWHFESDSLRGAFELDGRLAGAQVVEDGYIGRALSTATTRGAYAEILVAHDPSFDLREGFSIRCAAKPLGSSTGAILTLGGAAGLSVSTDGVLRAWLVPEVVESKGSPRRGGRIWIESPPGALAPGRWSLIEFNYDRRLSRLSVDGVEVARTEEVQPVWRIEAPIYVGDPRGAFPGLVDSLVVEAVTAAEVAELPDGVRFGPDTPLQVLFDARGHLDAELHQQPVEFDLVFDEGSTQSMRVGLYGTVE